MATVAQNTKGGRNGGRMKIGELARKTGKTVRALHLYEEMGLLNPARSDGGFRLYGPDEFARVSWIAKLQEMGFKLGQIRGLLDAVAASKTAPDAMDGVRKLFQGKLEETRTQVQRLLRLERDLAESLAYLEACHNCQEASAKACASCSEERHVLPEPSLVTGIHLGSNGAVQGAGLIEGPVSSAPGSAPVAGISKAEEEQASQ